MKFAKRILAFVLIIAAISTYNTYSLNISSNAATDTYTQNLINAGFPESYATKLAALHAIHPQWQFEPVMVTEMNSKFTWDYVVNSENSAAGNTYYNLVTTSSWAPGSWYNLGNANYSPYYDTNNTNMYDSGWRKASKEAVSYFMDPRNFLNDTDIFMFEHLGYNASYQNETLVNKALSGSFMGNNAMCDNGKTYAQHITTVGASNDISPVFLAGRLKQEQGLGTSPLVNGTIGTTLLGLYKSQADYDANGNVVWGSVKKGTVYTEAELLKYNGYYNFFNMGASGTGVFAIYLNGGNESLTNGWNTKAAAISGGAAIVADKYIQDYQASIYFQKFNVDPRSSRALWGQYMQNIAAPLTEGRNARATYLEQGLLEEAHIFKIPVFSGMPAAACPDPAKGNSYYSATKNNTGTSACALNIYGEGNGAVAFDTSGTVSTKVAPGTVVNFMATPEAGYRVAKVLVDGVEISTLNNGGAAVYSFTMPYGAVDINVTFDADIDPIDIVFDNQNVVDWTISGGVSDNVAVGLTNDPSGDKACVFISPESNDPQANFNFKDISTFSASSYKYMIITAKTTASNTNGAAYFCAGSTVEPTPDCYRTWTWINDGLWHEYVIDLSLSTQMWSGNVNLIRFDFFEGDTEADSALYLRSIKFSDSAPSKAVATTDSDSYIVGESIKINYSGLARFLNTNDNIVPFVAIYAEGTSPGNGKALQYVYANSASGSVTFPTAAIGGTNTGTLPAGKYTAWVAYDAQGTSPDGTYTVNNVHLYSCEGYAFSITASGYSIEKGELTNSNVIIGNLGDTVSKAITGIKSLTGASAVTITSSSGSSVATSSKIATGMKVSVGGTTYNLVIKGDTNCDGAVTMDDSTRVYQHLLGTSRLSGAASDAAKVNKTSSVITILDVMQIIDMANSLV